MDQTGDPIRLRSTMQTISQSGSLSPATLTRSKHQATIASWRLLVYGFVNLFGWFHRRLWDVGVARVDGCCFRKSHEISESAASMYAIMPVVTTGLHHDSHHPTISTTSHQTKGREVGASRRRRGMLNDHKIRATIVLGVIDASLCIPSRLSVSGKQSGCAICRFRAGIPADAAAQHTKAPSARAACRQT
jgi:hypothetical protein